MSTAEGAIVPGSSTSFASIFPSNSFNSSCVADPAARNICGKTESGSDIRSLNLSSKSSLDEVSDSACRNVPLIPAKKDSSMRSITAFATSGRILSSIAKRPAVLSSSIPLFVYAALRISIALASPAADIGGWVKCLINPSVLSNALPHALPSTLATLSIIGSLLSLGGGRGADAGVAVTRFR